MHTYFIEVNVSTELWHNDRRYYVVKATNKENAELQVKEDLHKQGLTEEEFFPTVKQVDTVNATCIEVYRDEYDEI